ncbi:MAG TPA: HEAT repeat domain-containing protein [Verrucomicrobiae bacterium]
MHARLFRAVFPLVALAFLASAIIPAPAADPAPGQQKRVVTDDPAAALKTFRVAPGLTVDLFAAEPDVLNPVSLCFDEQGRCYVVETTRRRSSVFDIRGHKDWLEADFSFRTVQERIDFLKHEVTPTNKTVIKRLTGGGKGTFEDFNHDSVIDWRDLEVQSERIRLLEDTDGDGRADRARIFADGFNSIVSGVAAGVLARHGEVYFTCIPDLWKFTIYDLRFTNGISSEALPINPHRVNRKSQIVNLLSGFGVHIAFGGHDMHGLIFGPDGKLYWSIADRGTDTNLWAKIKDPWPGLTPELLADSGCIFRCNPDGSDFEVVACGLRNPQELAFDDFGNLFTADNNGDGGDKARWHYVVEGADFGWRIGWQWLPKMGAWNSERLWHLAPSNTAAYLLPPLAHIGHGPAGLAYNPGTGLPPEFAHHFFLCDFPGSVLMWTNIPDGASFKVGPVKSFFGELGPSDVAFGVDGGVYVTDWLKSFDKPEKGRIYRIHDPATDKSAGVQETKKLLAEGMEKWSDRDLGRLLGFQDMRVRLDAQFELMKRFSSQKGGKDSPGQDRQFQILDVLERVAFQGSNRISRIHAIWTAGRIANTFITGNRNSTDAFLPLLDDPDPEVRAQVLRALGDDFPDKAETQVQRALRDPDDRVRLLAAQTYGKLAHKKLVSDENQPARYLFSDTTPLTDLLRSRGDDPYLRHAAVLALARIGDVPALLAAANDNSRSVRLGVLLALRRLASPEVARFLNDSDPQLVLEAARAIHDVPIPAALPALAAWLPAAQSEISNLKSEMTQFTLRRALNANFRLGHATNAQALAEFAAHTNAAAPLRVEALELLADWAKPPARDRVLGLWRPLPVREGAVAARALQPVLGELQRGAPDAVRLAATRSANKLGVQSADSFALLSDTQLAVELRLEALKSLAAQRHPRLPDALKLALADAHESLRLEATRLQAQSQPAEATGPLASALDKGTLAEKQNALSSLATVEGTAADDIISKQLDDLLANKAPKELHLDILEAAAQRTAPGIKDKLARFEGARPKNDPLAKFRETLFGGNADEGKKIFIENQAVACFRCHKVNGEGGEVGPELTGIALKKDREYLLESIVTPNTQIAPGFETLLVTMKNGTLYAGQFKKETDTELEINSPEDGLLKLPKASIKARDLGLSAMPEELASILSKRELRDLIEFLSGLK